MSARISSMPRDEVLLAKAQQDAVTEHCYRGVACNIGDERFFAETLALRQFRKLDIAGAGSRSPGNAAAPFFDDKIAVRRFLLMDDYLAGLRLYFFHLRQQVFFVGGRKIA